MSETKNSGAQEARRKAMWVQQQDRRQQDRGPQASHQIHSIRLPEGTYVGELHQHALQVHDNGGCQDCLGEGKACQQGPLGLRLA